MNTRNSADPFPQLPGVVSHPGPGGLRKSSPLTHPLGLLAYFVYLLGDSVTMAIATSSSHPSWGEVGQKFLYLKKKLFLSEGKQPGKKKKKNRGFVCRLDLAFRHKLMGFPKKGFKEVLESRGGSKVLGYLSLP